MKKALLFLLLFALSLLYSCSSAPKKQVDRAFYFWRTVFDLSASDQQALLRQGINRLYTRFFDVLPDPSTLKPNPVQDIRFIKPVDSRLEIVPVVFIANDALLHLDDSVVLTLAREIVHRIFQLQNRQQGQHLQEIQIDCDWTPSTRERYFDLLSSIRARLKKEKIILSATIRLHQVKYYERTGVPPVDRGMLMFYNMGKLEDLRTANSIYDAHTAACYLYNFSTYPLPLDVALPCFSWAVVIAAGHVSRLVTEGLDVPPDTVKGLERTDANHFKVIRETKLWNGYLHPGESIRLEKVDAALCKDAALQIAPYLHAKSLHVAIYHLKKNQINADEKQAFERIYHCFD